MPNTVSYFAIEVIPHRHFFAGGLGVHLDDDDIRLLLQRGQYLIDRRIRAVGRLHENTADQRNHADCGAFGGLIDREILARRTWRKIGRANDIVGTFKRRNDVPLAIGMVAERNQVDAVFEQLVIDLRRQARAARRVLRVGDHAVDAAFLDKRQELVGQYAPARPSDNIANAQNIDLHFRALISSQQLACVFDAAYFTQQRYLDLARIRHFLFDLLGDIACGLHAVSSSILSALTITRISRPA